MKKYYKLFIFILLLISALTVNAEGLVNTGFIPGQIWYSKATLLEGDTANIYTAVWNGEKESISVKVEFYDKNVILGNREAVIGSMVLKDFYVPWKITSGDHVISAKIVSSVVTVSGKKETVILDRNTTSNDKQFVPVVVKNNIGETVSQADALKIQIDKTTSELNSIVPEKVSSSISDSFTAVDNFRNNSYKNIDIAKKDAQKEIARLSSEVKKVDKNSNDKVSVEDATKKPITYIKLFLLTILSFILGSKLVFYGVLIVFIFLVLRFIYRKIRNR